MVEDVSIDEALGALGSHPRLEDLRAHQESRLTRAELERIEAHIGCCPSCAEWAGDLEVFLGPPQEDSASRPFVAQFREIGLLRPLAAVLLVATVLSFGAWLTAQRQVARLESGEINVPIVAIDKELRRQAEPSPDQPPLEVPPRAVLIFTPPMEPKPVDHEVRITLLDDRPGRLVWSEKGLRPTSKGSFHLRLPRDLRPGETYRIQIVPGEGQGLTIRVMASGQE